MLNIDRSLQLDILLISFIEQIFSSLVRRIKLARFDWRHFRHRTRQMKYFEHACTERAANRNSPFPRANQRSISPINRQIDKRINASHDKCENRADHAYVPTVTDDILLRMQCE